MRKGHGAGFAVAAMALALAFVSCSSTPVPTGDFNVTVMAKTSAHPLYGVGSNLGYVVNGVEGKALTLVRGSKYTFGINASGHPFYLSLNKDGGSGFPGEWTTGVTGTRTEIGLLTFTPDATTPSPLYYDCGVHPDMGGTITITP